MNTTNVNITENKLTVTERHHRFTDEQISNSVIDETTSLPSLASSVAMPVSLSVEYWSPEIDGETKRGWILGIEFQVIHDMETGEERELESVLFVEETSDGKKARFYNSSKILVANVKDAIRRSEIIPASILTPVQITYAGQKKNRTNSKSSNRWQILPLIIVEKQSPTIKPLPDF